MKEIYFAFLLSLLFISGCSSLNEENSFSSSDIRQYAIDAVAGNSTANTRLSELYDYNIPAPGEANNIIIDSISAASGKMLYFVIIEHSNPVYNRFAVYDNTLRAYIIDKSLNGNITHSFIDSLSTPCISVNENFLSKDTLNLERVSLYRISDSSAALSFRTFTKLIIPGNEFIQNIDEISDARIKTSITSTNSSAVNRKGDIFTYQNNIYVSDSDVFNKFVADVVNNYQMNIEKPQITDQRSALESVGINTDTDSIADLSTAGAEGFLLTLDETWKELKNVSITSYLNREFKGTRFLNNNLGASIYVISIRETDSAEMYLNYKLDQSSEGKYKLRFSHKLESDKNFIRFFEYSCGTRKFIVIFEAPKYTYEKNRILYEDIFNTFVMDC